MKPSNRFESLQRGFQLQRRKCHGAKSFKTLMQVLADEKALSLRKESPLNLWSSLFILSCRIGTC